MNPQQGLAERFEGHRGHLRVVAYRMLGSADEADDAVQEVWLRLHGVDADAVENLGGWLRTVVSRVCLDMLRSRRSRREDLVGRRIPDESAGPAAAGNPEREVLMADSVGRALLVVLDALAPDERVAFVLHDMFAVPFDQIAPIVDRSRAATKKLASRARHKVRGTPAIGAAKPARHRTVVEEFLAASRTGDIDAVIAVLAPDAVRRADATAVPADRAGEVRGARTGAKEIMVFGRNARFAEPALVDGAVGVIVAPQGRLLLAVAFEIEEDRVRTYELIGDPARLNALDLAVLETRPAGP